MIYEVFSLARRLLSFFLVWHETNCEEDRGLILRCQEGDDVAFETLVKKYQRELFHLVSWNVGGGAEAEDIVQEVLCKVYFSLRRFDIERPFYPWLRRVTINQCYDELRRVRRRKIVRFTELSEQEALTLERYMASPHADSDTPSPGNDEVLRALMQKVLDRLPERQRMAIVLRDFKQVSYGEMAEVMKCSKQAVRLKVFRARARLRTLMLKSLRRQEKLSHATESAPYGARLAAGRAQG